MKTIIINQFFGIGDIIFSMTAIRTQFKDCKIIWPVLPGYVEGLNYAYPDITFVDQSLLNLDYNIKSVYNAHGADVIPLRFSNEILSLPYTKCMESKYAYFGMPYKSWRGQAYYKRNTTKEIQLRVQLGIRRNEQYNLINKTFRSDSTGKAEIEVNNGLRNIYMNELPGHSLFDWSGIIANAVTIHTVSTSIFYLLELLKLKAAEIHLYVRKPDEANFKTIDYLFTKDYTLHL